MFSLSPATPLVWTNLQWLYSGLYWFFKPPRETGFGSKNWEFQNLEIKNLTEANPRDTIFGSKRLEFWKIEDSNNRDSTVHVQTKNHGNISWKHTYMINFKPLQFHEFPFSFSAPVLPSVPSFSCHTLTQFLSTKESRIWNYKWDLWEQLNVKSMINNYCLQWK